MTFYGVSRFGACRSSLSGSGACRSLSSHLEPEDMEKLVQKQTLSQKKCVGQMTMAEQIKTMMLQV